jgi:hypothetical protein
MNLPAKIAIGPVIVAGLAFGLAAAGSTPTYKVVYYQKVSEVANLENDLNRYAREGWRLDSLEYVGPLGGQPTPVAVVVLVRD